MKLELPEWYSEFEENEEIREEKSKPDSNKSLITNKLDNFEKKMEEDSWTIGSLIMKNADLMKRTCNFLASEGV